jgi:hypothetical protein
MQTYIVKGRDVDGEIVHVGVANWWDEAQNLGQRAKLSGEVVDFKIESVH